MSPFARTVQLPPPVRPGDRVGVAALSGPVDLTRLDRGLAELEKTGFEPVVARNVRAPRHLLFAGSDEERLDAFHELAAREDLGAILFARGGYGLTRILDRIDWRLLARRPRAYVGYSDLTPFLDQVVRRLGIAAFHGPMVAGDWARGLDADETHSILAALAGEIPTVMPVTEWLRPRPAVGRLVGGCLSMLIATLGTEAAPDLDGAILVLEDVHEPLYRVDRMLTQLRHAGALDNLSGLVLGHFSQPPGGEADPSLRAELLAEAVAPFDWPVAFGLPCGHEPPNLTVPLGLPGRLDPETGSLHAGLLSPLDGKISQS